MKYINIDALPRKGLQGKSIDWKNTIGYKCPFIYEDIEGEVEIINYSNPHITFKYLENQYIIRINKFKKCQFGIAMNKYTPNFKVEIGEVFKNNERDITIIDREYRMASHGYNIKYYKYRCNIDGNEDWVTESCLLTKNQGCNLCAGRKVVKGINDIATTNEWMINYFANTKDANKYAKCSGKFAKMKCPDCGYIKNMQIKNLYQHGFSCNKCGSGFSYPSKFMLNLLEQLNIDFIPEYCPYWISPKRYDFYIPSKNLIIEMDGGWHYSDNEMSGFTREEAESVDNHKDNTARSHNINVIRINCDYTNINTRFQFIKNNILCSELVNYFNFEDLDWFQINSVSTDDVLGDICTSIDKLANKFGMSIDELIKYINIGKKGGLFK